MPPKETPLRKHPGIYDRGEAYRGKRYSVRFDIYEGQTRLHRRQGFSRLAEAIEFQRQTEAAVSTGAVNDPSLRRQSVQEFAEHWILKAKAGLDDRTYKERHRILRAQVYTSALATMPLGSVVLSDVQHWVNSRTVVRDGQEVPMAAPTVRNYYGVVSGMFRAALRDRILAHSPCDGVKLPKSDRPRIVALSEAQVMAITAALPARYAAMATVGARAGLRIGEVLGLTVDRLDLTPGNAFITVDRQWRKDGRFGEPKTKASTRRIPISDELVAELLAHMATFPPGTREYGDARPGKPAGSGHLFTTERGNALWHPAWSNIWTATIAGLGLDPAQRHDHFHALRHHYASSLIFGGVDILVVRDMMGHDDVAVTHKTYSHWIDEDRHHAAVRNALRHLTIADLG